jgi:hypothetical protein
VATFSNLRVNALGAGYTLVASTATLGTASSTPFPVDRGASGRVAIGRSRRW